MRLRSLIAIAVIVSGCHSLSRETASAVPPSATGTPPVPTEGEDEEAWSFSAAVSTYFVPGDRDYVQPTITADRGRLHLEARYNYEDLDTASVWVGYNMSFGEKLTFDFTPMLGGVFGRTSGVAPGYSGTLSWSKLELYSEGEFVFDTGDSSGSFFYTWTELTLAPLDWLRFGLVAQRTKVYETEFDIQRGFLLGFAYKNVDFTTYVFDPDASQPTLVLGLSVSY